MIDFIYFHFEGAIFGAALGALISSLLLMSSFKDKNVSMGRYFFDRAVAFCKCVVKYIKDTPHRKRHRFLANHEKRVNKLYEELLNEIKAQDCNGDEEWYDNAWALFHAYCVFRDELKKRKGTKGGYGHEGRNVGDLGERFAETKMRRG